MTLRLTDEQEADLEAERSIERLNWVEYERAGAPRSEDLRLWDMLNLEMEFYCATDPAAGQNVAWLMSEWVRDGRRNPFLIDAALVRLNDASGHPSPAMWPEIALAAQQRIGGRRAVGTPAKIKRESVHSSAFVLMVIARLAGYSLEKASEKAAVWLDQSFPKFGLTASTLERRYTAQWRSPEASGRSREDGEVGRWTHPAMEQQRKGWEALIASLPEPDDGLKGIRR